jgi:hypothetical protein
MWDDADLKGPVFVGLQLCCGLKERPRTRGWDAYIWRIEARAAEKDRPGSSRPRALGPERGIEEAQST